MNGIVVNTAISSNSPISAIQLPEAISLSVPNQVRSGHGRSYCLVMIGYDEHNRC